ncbi:transposase [Microcoleus sp. FACHB-61]|nr:transposase [Microcoleus sp. FACHB-61]
MDNNSTHRKKLKKYLIAEQIASEREENITVELIYTPTYSPNFNLAEYLIHLLRRRLLHHLPVGTSIEEVEKLIKELFETEQLQTQSQLAKTIQQIYNLIL